MVQSIKFGTDGWRAIIAEDFTFDNVRACAQAVADYFKGTKVADKGVVIGYDTRFASEDFASACAEVLAAAGISVILCSKPAPTPVISYTVASRACAGGIIITASHNPGNWNGFKVKDASGASAPTEMISRIEKLTNEILQNRNVQRLPLASALAQGRVSLFDPAPAYFAHLAKLVDLDFIRGQKLKVIADAMFGAGSGYFKSILGGGQIQLDEIHGERNPIFPGLRPEPIARNLGELCRVVIEREAGVGLATDGDADRIGIVSEVGEYINQLEVFSLLALYFIEIRGERRPIVRTLTSSNMLDILGRKYGLPVHVSKVGFKYVAPLMQSTGAFMGGEESGGYGFSGHVPERDGILAGLYFLDFMARTGKTPSQLLKHLFDIVGPHYYDRYDLQIAAGQQQATLQKIKSQSFTSLVGVKVDRVDKIDGFKYLLQDDSWLLLRFSGTEPLIRIYAEAGSKQQVTALLEAGKKMLGA
jgi:alpha-D-glucose phosphate-specific phosphoglucomutase